MKQNSKMLPAIANTFNGGCGYSDHWKNFDADVVQNWQRTDLTSLENAEYAPGKDKTGSTNYSYTASAPAGVSVTTSFDHPEIYRDVTYTSDAKFEGYFDFDGYAADDNNSQIGLTSTWITDRPSSSDRVAPSYFRASFEGITCDTYSSTKASDSTFVFFEYSDFS